MGLQNQLSDVSSESILILMVVLIGKSARYLYSVFFTILRLFSPRFDSDHAVSDETFHEFVGSGLAGLVLLTEQLNLNRDFFYTKMFRDGVGGAGSDCVVCLNQLGEGDLVRKLACRQGFP
ncbi:unnamed protein product [Fraxinus pennsylvanica]|uniref:Uncharacterized protein n=1 Tax=Fraxinus pennsylvanica TaxID=56036 RepID=A0AAD2DX68_9LAMI|nr:unnamed protein product [Fraxinus pennsylvanica]